MLSQVVSVLVERAVLAGQSRAMARGARLRALLVDRAREDRDIVHALGAPDPSVADLVECDGAAVSRESQLMTMGTAPTPSGLATIVSWLNDRRAERYCSSSFLREDAPQLAADCEGFPGLLAIRFSPEPNSYVMWFRREELASVRWAGRPEKTTVTGPHGPRLSPRGSFAEWKQEVRGHSVPWASTEIENVDEFQRLLAR
jgi:light-regulated signal transduction histidine kinase (bacteriophytochrome)